MRGDRISRVLVDETQLVLRVGVEKLGVVLVMGLGPRVVEEAEMAPRGLLDRARGLVQYRTVRPQTDNEIGQHASPPDGDPIRWWATELEH